MMKYFLKLLEWFKSWKYLFLNQFSSRFCLPDSHQVWGHDIYTESSSVGRYGDMTFILSPPLFAGTVTCTVTWAPQRPACPRTPPACTPPTAPTASTWTVPHPPRPSSSSTSMHLPPSWRKTSANLPSQVSAETVLHHCEVQFFWSIGIIVSIRKLSSAHAIGFIINVASLITIDEQFK